jgi:hypothetical protein
VREDGEQHEHLPQREGAAVAVALGARAEKVDVVEERDLVSLMGGPGEDAPEP